MTHQTELVRKSLQLAALVLRQADVEPEAADRADRLEHVCARAREHVAAALRWLDDDRYSEEMAQARAEARYLLDAGGADIMDDSE